MLNRMTDPTNGKPPKKRRRTARIQKETILYSRIVPILLVILVIGLVATLVIVGLSVAGVI